MMGDVCWLLDHVAYYTTLWNDAAYSNENDTKCRVGLYGAMWYQIQCEHWLSVV